MSYPFCRSDAASRSAEPLSAKAPTCTAEWGPVGALALPSFTLALGATFAVSCGATSDSFRGSAGGIFRLGLGRPDELQLDSLLEGRGLRRLAATPDGGTPYVRADLTGPCALLFGSEGSGLPDDWLSRVDGRISIPMRRGVESLSVAAAAAVLLFEAARQRSEASVTPDAGS